MYLGDEVREEGIGLVVCHTIVLLGHQQLKQSLQEVQALKIHGGVGVKEMNGHPAKQEVDVSYGRLLEIAIRITYALVEVEGRRGNKEGRK